MWIIYEQPKSCGHPLTEVDHTCVMCLYVELCKVQDQLREAQNLIHSVGRIHSAKKALAFDVNTYEEWALR